MVFNTTRYYNCMLECPAYPLCRRVILLSPGLVVKQCMLCFMEDELKAMDVARGFGIRVPSIRWILEIGYDHMLRNEFKALPWKSHEDELGGS